MSCSNNLKQLGLAAHNYESAFSKIPPSLIVDLGNPVALPFPGIVHSWAVNLLPYIEQENLFRLYNMNFPWFAPNNQVPLRTSLKTFICPSTPGGSNRTTTGTFTFGAPFAFSNLAVTDYATNSSINTGSITFFGYPAGTTQLQTWSAMRPSIKGPAAMLALVGFPPVEPNTFSSITDGTSNTILLCEDAGRPDYYIGGRLASSNTRTDGGWGNHENDYGLDGAVSKTSDSSPGNCVINCHNNNETYAFHTGGAMHVFTDGGVKFIRETISGQTYAALMTCQGGSLTPAETSPSVD